MAETNLTTTDGGIAWALKALRINAERYALASSYYEGNHKLTFSTEKFNNAFGRLFSALAINHCGVCVDVPADKLQLEGFRTIAKGEGEAAENTAADTKINEILRRNRMNKRWGEIHKEAFKSGDSYVVVDWVNDVSTIHPNPAGRCAVKYDEENPGFIIQAARWWPVAEPDGKKYRVRLNLYYPNRIEKYTTRARTTTDLPTREQEFVPIDGDWKIPNPHNKVPVFHYANNADIGCMGRSELDDIIAPQDGLNKAVCDAMVGAEASVIGQRYILGLEIHTDGNGAPLSPFHGGTDTLWVVPPQTDIEGKALPADQAQPITIGQFDPANLDQILKIKESFRQDISLISGIPAHYFMESSGGWPSGESMRTAEQRLTSKVIDRQISFGNVHEDVMRLCLEIEGIKNVQVEANWRDTTPHSVKEDIENTAVKVEKLDIPKEQAWKELNYKQAEIDLMKTMQDDEAVEAIRRDKTAVVRLWGEVGIDVD
jgi:hypothetical protein